MWKAIKEKLKEERRKRHKCGGRCAKRKKRKRCKNLKSKMGKTMCKAKKSGSGREMDTKKIRENLKKTLIVKEVLSK